MVYSEERRQLINAAECNDLETVKLLVEQKHVPLTATVAHIAARNGNMDLVRYVAEIRPSVLANKDEYGNTVLHLAIDKGIMDLPTLKFLVEKSDVPLIKTNDQLETIARIAARTGRVDIIKYVAEKKAFILSKKDITGRTVLHMANEKDVMDLVTYLEEKYGEDIPQWHRRDFESVAVHTAIEYGHMGVLKYFLKEKKCDVDITNERDETPIFSALKYGRHDILRYLVEEYKANLTLLDENNENILFVAVRKDDLPAMKYILDERKADIDVDWRNNDGNTLLHEAAFIYRISVVEYLVEKKHADTNAVGLKKKTPLHCAASRNHYDLCKYLIEHGADPRAKDEEGHYPKAYTDDEFIQTYLRKATATRTRRSMNAQVVPIIYYGFNGNISRSANRLEGGSATSIDNIHSSKLLNFFMIATLIFGNAKSLIGRSTFPSREAILREKIDTVKVETISSDLYFIDE
jgi:ankyrin repeat protein